jgi:hypothetical protein
MLQNHLNIQKLVGVVGGPSPHADRILAEVIEVEQVLIVPFTFAQFRLVHPDNITS